MIMYSKQLVIQANNSSYSLSLYGGVVADGYVRNEALGEGFIICRITFHLQEFQSAAFGKN